MKDFYFVRRQSLISLLSSKGKRVNSILLSLLVLPCLMLSTQLKAQVMYCTPTYTADGYTHRIQTVTINSTFQHSPDASTHDYTSEEVSVDAGNPIHFELESQGYCGVGIAVDWNNDGDFDDADEYMANPLYIASTPATYDTTVDIPSGITSGSYRLRVWNIGANSSNPTGLPCDTYQYGNWDDYTLTILPPCSGTPSAGTLPATMAVCPNTDFTLTASGATNASGMSNQWQSHGESSSTWTDITGAINSSYTVSGGLTDTMYYRYISACDASGMADTTSEMMVTINPPSQCYCTPGNSSSYYISSFTTTNAENNIQQTGMTTSPNGYSDLTAVDTAAQKKTLDFDFSFNADGSYSFGGKVWIDWNHDGQFDNSEIVYQSTGYSSSFSGTVTVPLTATTGLTRMRVGISYSPSSGPATACEQDNSYYFQDYMFNVLPAPSCIAPEDLTVNSLTPTSANLAWLDTTGATEWQVEYDTTGFVQGTGTMVSNVLDTFTTESVNPNTQYDFYVRTVCGAGDTSYWSGPYTFHTPCSSYDANGFWETFEDTSTTLNCWSILDANNDGDKWEYYHSTYTNYANSGTWSARIHTDYNNGANDDYLISPAINLTGTESMKFSYRAYSDYYPNDFEVLISTTGTDPADFTDTLMHDASYSNADYKDTVVDLTSYTGTVYIAFHVPQGGLDGYYLYIDDVRFGECIPTPGTDGSVTACQTGGNVNLSNIIQTNNASGEWKFSANPNVLQGNQFNVSTLATGNHDVMYIVQGLCDGEADTTIATVNVYPPSSAGTGSTVTVCKNQPVNLFDALQGNVDLGGTWYDPTQQPITSSTPFAGSIPGSFNYTYIVDNGVCPADTGVANVVVDGTCDWLGLENEAFNKLSVFPNPTSNMINIVNPSNESNLKIVVLDMNGHVVLRDNTSLSNNDKATLSLGRLDKGIYTLKVSNTKGQKVFKIVKQ